MLFGTLIPRFGQFFRRIRGMGSRRQRVPPIPPAASSSTSSIELKETSFVSEDIELVQVSDSTSVHLIEMEGSQYCQAVQQGMEGNYEVALFANLIYPLHINHAAIFKKIKAGTSFRLYNESITGYVAAPKSCKQQSSTVVESEEDNCFTIVDSEEDSCVFMQDPATDRIYDTNSNLYMKVKSNKIVCTSCPEQGSRFSLPTI